MNILWLFDTCGLIFGPAIMLAGVFALGLCLWSSLRSTPPSALRRVIAMALAPAILGVGGAVFGLGVWWTQNVPGAPWWALGKVILAGMVVSAVPLIWALLLFRGRRNPSF